MATWQDGPEYAPLAPPTGYEPAVANTPTVLDPPRRQAPDPTAPAGPGAATPPPAFAPPDGAVPLSGLTPDRPPSRDPRHPFPLVSRPQRTGSAWRSVHASATASAPTPPPVAVAEPYDPAPYEPAAYDPAPYDPAAQAQAPAPQPPLSFLAPRRTGFADLDQRARAARWLLLPPVLYILGAVAGPFVTVAVLAGAILLAAAPTIPVAARALSRIVSGLVGALLLLGFLVGRDWTELAGTSRYIGLIYCVVLGIWYVRQRSAVDAEQHRREQSGGPRARR